VQAQLLDGNSTQAAAIQELKADVAARADAAAALTTSLTGATTNLDDVRTKLAASEAECSELRIKVLHLTSTLTLREEELGVCKTRISDLLGVKARLEGELEAERGERRAAEDTFARTQATRAELLEQRTGLRRQAAAAMTIQRAYRRWKAALLRARLAREEEARANLEAAQAHAARMAQLQAVNLGSGMVVDSLTVMRDAVEAILTTFVGRRKELALRDSLAARVATAAPLLSQAHRATVAASAASSGITLRPSASGQAASKLQRDRATAYSLRMVQQPPANIGPMALPRSVTLGASYSSVAPTMAEFTRPTTSTAGSLAPLGVARTPHTTSLRSTAESAGGGMFTGAGGYTNPLPQLPETSVPPQSPAMAVSQAPQMPQGPSDGGSTITNGGRSLWSPRALESSADQLAAAAATLRQRTPTRAAGTGNANNNARAGSGGTPTSTAVPTAGVKATITATGTPTSKAGGQGVMGAVRSTARALLPGDGRARDASAAIDTQEGSGAHSPPRAQPAPAAAATSPAKAGGWTKSASAAAVAVKGAASAVVAAAGTSGGGSEDDTPPRDVTSQVRVSGSGQQGSSGALAAMVQGALGAEGAKVGSGGSHTSYASAASDAALPAELGVRAPVTAERAVLMRPVGQGM